MRKVQVYAMTDVLDSEGKPVVIESVNGRHRKKEKTESYIGGFHGFGVDYEELTMGAGQFTTAIIEAMDGTVETVYLHMFKFIDDGVACIK
jgi:hypothetical protein